MQLVPWEQLDFLCLCTNTSAHLHDHSVSPDARSWVHGEREGKVVVLPLGAALDMAPLQVGQKGTCTKPTSCMPCSLPCCHEPSLSCPSPQLQVGAWDKATQHHLPHVIRGSPLDDVPHSCQDQICPSRPQPKHCHSTLQPEASSPSEASLPMGSQALRATHQSSLPPTFNSPGPTATDDEDPTKPM